MQHTSMPGVIRSKSAHSPSPTRPVQTLSDPSSGFLTITSSWASVDASSLRPPDRPSLAWSGVRHEVSEDFLREEANVVQERIKERCSQAVLVACLHLSHEMALRDVGLYAWTLPHVKDPQGSMMRIMKQYVKQMKRISKQDLQCRSAPDPSKASIQHQLQKARQAARQDSYVAVVYCGHGIQEPPTEAGELWCYDVAFEDVSRGGAGPSEYIPILLFDLLTWAGSSSCYVWDCQHAGRFIRAAHTEAREIDTQLRAAAVNDPKVAELHPAVYEKRQIHFAACGTHQTLPRVAGLPDDIFTACLTTPLRMALVYHNLQTFPLTTSENGGPIQRPGSYMTLLFENMSENLEDRLWSELQAIVSTIAWQSLDSADYQKVFGQSGDVVSSMAGGFLLSQRVLGTYRATPESIPVIPSSTSHALWTHWDLILDNFFEQLPSFKHFEEKPGDTSWETGLKLVSFMEDQLDSLLQADHPIFAADVGKGDQGQADVHGLSRLPIICQAVMTPEARVRACTALDTCLRSLDANSLAHAVEGGALDVAAQLLTLGDESIGPQIISIWASLVRNEACVKALSAQGKTAERLTSVPSVRFFLDTMESRLQTLHQTQSRTIVIESAAVLATIANFVSGRKAPRFSARTLKIACDMLDNTDSLVKQWGALLFAEVTGKIQNPTVADKTTVGSLADRLIEMATSPVVEDRAASVYALSQWVDSRTIEDFSDVASMVEKIKSLILRGRDEGSAVIRRETIKFCYRILRRAGQWADFAMLLFLLERVRKDLPLEANATTQWMNRASTLVMKHPDDRIVYARLVKILDMIAGCRCDPQAHLASLAQAKFKIQLDRIGTYMSGNMRDQFLSAASSSDPRLGAWTPKLAEEIRSAGTRMLEQWGSTQKPESRSLMTMNDNDLFEESKLSLHAYLANREDDLPDRLEGQPENSRERTWILRHRFLEDSLVVAEQQRGLPWNWSMKDISSPDQWSAICCHSFLNTVMSVNNTREIMMWDWSWSRKTGSVRLNIPANAHVTSAKFVNELQDRLVVLAEISNGNIYIMSGPADQPTKLRTVSSFLSLDVLSDPMPLAKGSPRQLVTTWWRQKGRLSVGGPSRLIRIWNGPEERCERTLRTDSDAPLATLITEPVTGNLLLGGFEDGIVKIWDLRQARHTPILQYLGDNCPSGSSSRVKSGQMIRKLGVVLGESKNVTAACNNGLINIHDLRRPSSPITSNLAHPTGISSASFQAHSGLMSTVSNLNPPFRPECLAHTLPSPNAASTSARPTIVPSLPPHHVPSDIQRLAGRPRADFGLFRSTSSSLSAVTHQQFVFDVQQDDVAEMSFKPFTAIHSLRPFLGVGYGRTTYLRASGVGQGDATDSGSYNFLQTQARFMAEAPSL